MLKRDCGGDGGGVLIDVIAGIGVVALAGGLLGTDVVLGVDANSN